MTGHDHQWLLNRRNFEGRWCGTSHWYLRPRDDDGVAGPLDLAHPSRTIPDTCYAISFSDPETGLWDGSGLLRAPGGRLRAAGGLPPRSGHLPPGEPALRH